MEKLKIHIIKFTAIVISVMYVLMPIHKEAKRVLHSISHFIEMPNAILSHNQNENLDYKVKTPTITYHEHKILDILDVFAEVNNDTEDSNKPSLVDSKIDKHFHSSKYKEQKLITSKSLAVIDSYTEKVKALFYRKIKVPPKTSNMQLS
ncbi:hypothetical protein [Wocania ichthyoenteri]|uniref:hypothetical protein n=1 Tax=Wocania ichthyoenteri TaxID=1230531 RepID=UPI00053E5216|nr:hypothetical protein [Wocania ichthyoenteri]